MKNFKKIDSYLKGKLPDEEVATFEHEISKNKELSEEVALQKLEEEALDYLVEKRLSARINKIKEGLKEEEEEKVIPQKKQLFPWSRFLAIAASIAIVIIAFLYFNTISSPQSFALKEYQEVPFEISKTRKDPTHSKITTPLFLAHEKKLQSNIPTAIKNAAIYFEHIPKKDSTFLFAQYYLGHAYFKLKQFKKSILYFEYSYDKSKPNSQLRDMSQYYLLLSYLATGDLPQAQSIFGDLKINNQRFKSRTSLHIFFKPH